MLFMTYRPKTAKNVKAEKVTLDNMLDIVSSFKGTAKVARDGEDVFLKIATLDGILEARVDQWVVLHEDKVEVVNDEEFTGKFDRARVTREG